MRSRLPWILLCVSVVLNLSIIGGVLYVGQDRWFGPKPGEGFIHRLAEDLKLDEGQRQSLEAMRAEVLAERTKLEKVSGNWSDFAISILDDPTYDGEAVRWAMIERSQPWREMTIRSMAELHGFVQQLDSTQRADFLTRVKQDRNFLRKLLGAEGT